MGTSNWQNISYCIDLIREVNPRAVLDIGVGFGRWGVICREFLDVWNGRVFREQWQVNVEGIEIFPKNIDEYHKYFYNQIYIQDAYDFLQNTEEKYDLIIIGDVLEHFEKHKGKVLLESCQKIAKNVLLNIPLGENWDQDELYENEFEIHRSTWVEQEFNEFSIVRKRIFKDYLMRDFATYLFSCENVFENKLKNSDAVNLSIEKIKMEIDLLRINIEENEKLLEDFKCERDNALLSEELKIENADSNQKHRVTLIIDETKNIKSNGYECWIYNIGSDQIRYKDLKRVEKEGSWEIRKDNESPTGEVLLSWQPKDIIKFNIIGKKVVLKCLTHPWSGCLTIISDNQVVKKVDLYNEEKKIILVEVELEGA